MYDYDHESFFRYFRMTSSQFDYILTMISLFISEDMRSHSPMSPTECMAMTIGWDVACVCANRHFCLFSASLHRYYILHVINMIISLRMTLWASLIG